MVAPHCDLLSVVVLEKHDKGNAAASGREAAKRGKREPHTVGSKQQKQSRKTETAQKK